MTHIFLIGPMGAGKTTLANALVENYGYRRWPSSTTRPMRPGETNGEDYYFIDDEQFDASLAYGYITAIREYHTKDGVWRYGFPVDPVPEGNTVSIIDPSGLIDIREKVPNIFPVFLDPDPDLRRMRVLVRGDDPDEIDRRFKADEIDFHDFRATFVKTCKLRIAKNRTPDENAQRIIEGIQAYADGRLQ